MTVPSVPGETNTLRFGRDRRYSASRPARASRWPRSAIAGRPWLLAAHRSSRLRLTRRELARVAILTLALVVVTLGR
jgi:hypothetical protein